MNFSLINTYPITTRLLVLLVIGSAIAFSSYKYHNWETAKHSAAAKQQAATELFTLINDRFAYMQDVGIYKGQHQLPITDVDREATLIERAREKAIQVGIQPNGVESLFRAMIEASKHIQQRTLDELTPDQLSERYVKDLINEVRPKLTVLTDEIIDQAYEYMAMYGPIEESQRHVFFWNVENYYLYYNDRKQVLNALENMHLIDD